MGMTGEYVRLTAAELERTLGDADWAHEWVGELQESAAESEAPPPEPRLHSTGKTWQALDFLLRRRAFPVDVVFGEADVPGAMEWGHSPPRHLTPERVAVAARALADLTPQALAEGVSVAEFAAAGLYPEGVWERDEQNEELDWVIAEYQDLVRFFRIAARYRQAVLLWIG
ncbi:YfbM family protein [Streptomyces sp. NPDC048290]|uniref:YfbM family protein n=1 Tax=Streptomyces sp. NPDC048290 TaxID=3155811 RepID=UPI003415193E